MPDLKGRVVIVTGASSGIGLETARAFAREGCRVAVCARRAERIEATARQLELLGAEVLSSDVDVRDEEQVGQFVRAVLDRWGRVDILVNNAGFGIVRPFAELSTEEIRDLMDTNFFGAVYFTKAVLAGMLPRRDGHIINVDSVVAKVPAPNYSVYSAAKAALDSLSQALRAELGPHGIHVTAVHPGATRTEYWEVAGSDADRGISRFLMQSPTTVAMAIVGVARRPRADVYPQPGTRLLPLIRALFPLPVRLVLRLLAGIQR